MTKIDYPEHPTSHGYMSEKIQRDYITSAIAKGVLPREAHRIAEVMSLTASSDPTKPIQFWQLYSVLGQEPIVRIVHAFYERVFADEDWFTSVFERIGDVNHHVNSQAGMWIDVMGGGPYYHGAEFRLNFHHTHNAIQLMNDKGAQRWSQLMLDTLDDLSAIIGDDPRIRPSINTFLSHFMTKYADDFDFQNQSFFGETNPPYKRKINFMMISTQAINALDEGEIRNALEDQGVDVTAYKDKEALVNKALMM